MSIPVLSLVVEGLVLVKQRCDKKLLQLESEGTDETTMLEAVFKYNQISDILYVAQNDLSNLKKL